MGWAGNTDPTFDIPSIISENPNKVSMI